MVYNSNGVNYTISESDWMEDVVDILVDFHSDATIDYEYQRGIFYFSKGIKTLFTAESREEALQELDKYTMNIKISKVLDC